MAFYGADTEALRELARTMAAGADDLDDRIDQLRAHAATVDWDGPDADTFRSELGRVRAGASSDRIRAAGQDLLAHADAQDQASILRGVLPQSPPGPMPPPVSPSSPVLEQATRDRLDTLLAEAIDTGFWGDLDGNSADIGRFHDALEALSPEERAAYISSLSDEDLTGLSRSLDESGEGIFGIGGNTPESRRRLLDAILRDAPPGDVARIRDAFPSLQPDGRAGGDAASGTFHVEPDGTTTPPGPVVPGDASWQDVDQGSYGDCVSMATLGMVQQNDPGWAAEHVRDNGNGTVSVTLYDADGNPDVVTMPAELPSREGRVIGASDNLLAADPNAPTWPAYVERALAIQMGDGYAGIEGHGSPEVGPRLTGMEVTTIPPTDADAAFAAADNGEPMIVGTAIGDDHPEQIPPGWVGGHGFWVEGTSTNSSGEEVLVLRNPHGKDSPTVQLTREQYAQWTSSAEVHHER